MSFTITFWGTRGSVPSPGPRTARYGGNTPCVELRTRDGALVVLDAGTGIRELGRSLLRRANGAAVEGDVFVTHAHWDHIQGLPFFAPFFRRGDRFTIWGPAAICDALAQAVRDQMSPVVFPVRFDELEATLEFRGIAAGDAGAYEGPGYVVHAIPVRHPGGAVGYRVRASGESSGHAGGAGTLVYVSDNELDARAEYDLPRDWRNDLVAFARGADVLVHDTMYSAEEYERRRGWGHSTFGDAVALAVEAGVKTLVLYHHEPDRADDELDRRVLECEAMARAAGSAVRVVAAAEGMTMTI